MTSLATGSSVGLTLRDTGIVNVATNGGVASVTVTPTGGAAQLTNIGPMSERRSFGPYSEGAQVTIANQSAALDFDSPLGINLPLAQVLSQSAIPVILAPNGTVATNGTITLGTALPVVYANAWVRLPAGAVVGGAAGLYYATFSSTTVGIITTSFADPANAFVPYIPAITVVAVGSNAAYTQTTAADITLANITVPGGLMGANGALRFQTYGTQNNTANAKTLSVKFVGVTLVGSSGISNGSVSIDGRTKNRSASSQISHEVRGAIAGLTPIYSTINTSVDQSFTVTAQIVTATDYMALDDFTLEVLPA